MAPGSTGRAGGLCPAASRGAEHSLRLCKVVGSSSLESHARGGKLVLISPRGSHGYVREPVTGPEVVSTKPLRLCLPSGRPVNT